VSSIFGHHGHLKIFVDFVIRCFSDGSLVEELPGGFYALMAAHVASLLLNWDSDTLIFRQRIREVCIISSQVSLWTSVYTLFTFFSKMSSSKVT